MVVIKWTKQAIDDVDNIAAFIAKDSFKYAQIQVQIFFEKALILENHLFIGRIVPEYDMENLRELIQGNYRIIYTIISKTKIDIISVHHSKRMLKNNPTFKK